MNSSCQYSNIQIHNKNGKKTLNKVMIKRGKGYKTVCVYKRGKCIHTVKKSLSSQQINDILNKNFIPGLFNDCKMPKSKTRKNRK